MRSPSGSRRLMDGARSSPLARTAPTRNPRGRRLRDGSAQQALPQKDPRARRPYRQLTMSRAMGFPSGSGRPRPMRNLGRRRSIDPFSQRRPPRLAIRRLPVARLRRREPRPSSTSSVSSPSGDAVPVPDAAVSHDASQDAKPADDAARHLAPPAGTDGAAGAQLAALSPDEICQRDEDRLAQLRMNPSSNELVRFANELGCQKLLPQVVSLMKSLAPPPAAADVSTAAPPDAKTADEAARPAPVVAGADVAALTSTRAVNAMRTVSCGWLEPFRRRGPAFRERARLREAAAAASASDGEPGLRRVCAAGARRSVSLEPFARSGVRKRALRA